MTDLVILIRGTGSDVERNRTLEALRRNTPNLDVAFLEPHRELEEGVLVGRRLCVVDSGQSGGVLPDHRAWNSVRALPGADVVLVDVGTCVGPDWHDALRGAAHADDVIATASALRANVLDLHDGRSGSPSLYGEHRERPTLPRPLWGCVYLRRSALDVAANARLGTDSNGGPISIEELVMSPGLVHVLVPEVVLPTEPGTHDRVHLLTPAVRRSLAQVEAASEPLRVTIDLRCCSFPLSGTQVHALNLVSSLAKRDDLRLTVIAPETVSRSVRPYFDELPGSVTRYSEGHGPLPKAHVFHRPYQLFHSIELDDAVAAGARFVLTHQDLILDRVPTYFRSEDDWFRYVHTTAVSLATADEVVFFSEHARGEALRDGLVDRAKTSVVPPGTDHLDRENEVEAMPRRASEVLGMGRRTFLLVFGNAYLHKNRLFALRVAEQLRRTSAWNGAVVLAGGTPGPGASVAEERAFVREHEALRQGLVDLGTVTDGERRWLYRHASLVMYPTLYEGFGLIPFEAAAVGTACAYSRRSSVAEFLPSDGAILDLGDVVGTASRVRSVLESREASDGIVRAIRRSGESLTWSRTADSYVEVYQRSLTRPVGLALLSGQGEAPGVTSSTLSSETERRLIILFRRSATARLLAKLAFTVAISLRRIARCLHR